MSRGEPSTPTKSEAAMSGTIQIKRGDVTVYVVGKILPTGRALAAAGIQYDRLRRSGAFKACETITISEAIEALNV